MDEFLLYFARDNMCPHEHKCRQPAVTFGSIPILLLTVSSLT